jgi:hypothetical protein
MKHTISTGWLVDPNQGCSHFPHNNQSSHEYLDYYQSEGSCAHQMITQVPPIRLIMRPRMVIKFEHVVQSLLNTCIFDIRS